MQSYLKVFVKYDDIYDIAIQESNRKFEVAIEKDDIHKCEFYIPINRVYGTSVSEDLLVKFQD